MERPVAEREQLEQAIATLEEQRAILGDAVVDPAIAGLRKQLAELGAAPGEQARKQATVLFADVSGFTAMSETFDAEEMTDLMSALWRRIDAVIVEHGGMIDKHIGDAVMALWGVHEAREDDPERAIRAALAMQAELAVFAEERDVHLAMRAGLSTGSVLLGEVRPGEFTAMGDTVNLASRMEQAAPVGGVLISYDTYRHVRGVFDVMPQEPLAVKGKADLVQTYVVQQAKPRAFRMATRGVEGVETRMVGRDAELLTLQNISRDVMEDSETRVVTVVGEAGVGKSRLLYEFENWIDLLSDRIHYFKGRARPEMQTIPYGIVRDMFAHRFDIRESDSAATVLDKFRAGMGPVLEADKADLIGHLIGFDFSTSQAVRNLLGSPSFGDLATAYFTNYFRAFTSEPVAILLEDIHWADGSSLNLFDHLVTSIPSMRLLVVCLARPSLFEWRKRWGEGQNVHTRLDLGPLSRRASRTLVDEILQKVDSIPDGLRDMVVDGAEGNPYYVEELIKMLIEDGVILHQEDQWQVRTDRLAEVRVPPTLTGVLQSRLDSLPREEKTLLQRASVVGRMFWDAVVAELEADEADRIAREEVGSLLDAIRGRELVFRRERSAFEGAEEYIFKHAILRDVTYETVLLKLRRVYHAQVAKWLEVNAGGRAGEYLGLIAGHYELAGEQAKAADYLRLWGAELSKVGAFRDAIGPYERALRLLPEEEVSDRAVLLVELGTAYDRVGDYVAAMERFEKALELSSRPSGRDPRTVVAALTGLGWSAWQRGEHYVAGVHLNQGLALARENDDREGIANLLRILGRDATSRGGDHDRAREFMTESLALYRELGSRQGIADALREYGVIALLQGEHDEAERYLEESLTLYETIGDRRGIAGIIIALGEKARKQARYEESVAYYEESLAIARELGLWWTIEACLNNLGHVYADLGKDDLSWKWLREALREAIAVEEAPIFTLEALVGVAKLEARAGRHIWAAELLGLVLGHPALDEETKQYAEPALATLRATLSAEELETALARGESLDHGAVIARILEEGAA